MDHNKRVKVHTFKTFDDTVATRIAGSFVNEAKINIDPVDFRYFIDYNAMKRPDFKENYGEELVGMPTVMTALADLWKNCKLEAYKNGDEMYPSADKMGAPKYPYLYVFTEDIGVPSVYIISSSYADLLKRVSKPDAM